METNIAFQRDNCAAAQWKWQKLSTTPWQRLRDYYSEVLGRKIDDGQMAHLLHSQVSFFGLLLLANGGFILATLGLAWFATAIGLCRRKLR